MEELLIPSFLDELNKIAAHCARSGSPPIRPHNLADKTHVDKSGANGQRMKLAGATIEAGKEATKKLFSPNVMSKAVPAIAGIAAWETGKTALNDWRTGRAYRKQMEGRQG